VFLRFVLDSLAESVRGGRKYHFWLVLQALTITVGVVAYIHQLRNGLIVTGMSDQVSWGVYIANFTFLVGVAAAAVMVVIPAYVFHHKGAKDVVLLAEAVAVAASLMCIVFVMVDLGRPERFWHMIPFIGRFNWPISILAWDVVVLSGYLALNIFIPMYFLYNRYRGTKPSFKHYFPWIVISIFWAVSIHTVTAFLFSWNPARPFWHTALMAPRFIASAFAAGPAVIILIFKIVDQNTDFKIGRQVVDMLSLVCTVALQVNLFMIGTEIFTEFYSATSHTASARYLFLGIGEARALVPWIYAALFLEVVAVVILMIHPLRMNLRWLYVACGAAIVGIWLDKGMGMIVPGFVPTPLGEVFEYTPSWTEFLVALGVWALGSLVMTLFVKSAIGILLDRVPPDREHQHA
jgi:molybdopterin-containing oxidoreductase family membrane subunit